MTLTAMVTEVVGIFAGLPADMLTAITVGFVVGGATVLIRGVTRSGR